MQEVSAAMAAPGSSCYSVKEKVEMVLVCAEMNSNYRLAAQLYSSCIPGLPVPEYARISPLYKHFLKAGYICYRKCQKGVVLHRNFEIVVLANRLV